MKQRRLLLALSSLLLQATTTTTALEARNPVRIFLLAGDDAAEGYASIDHLRSLIVNASTPSGIRDRYVHLVNDDDDDDNEFRTRHDAFVAYDRILDDDDDNDDDHEWMSGPISQVFFGATPQTFGPELEMGHVLGNAFEEPIVIVKAAWRQASLADDFVAPNGPEYKHLLESVKRTIDNLEDILLTAAAGRFNKIAYNKDAGHVLSGVVWFQGYSDLRVKQYRDSYREHLTQFLTDLRRDLQPYTGKSALLLRPFPIIVGELGGMGTKPVVATPPQPLITAAERWQLEQSMRETQRTTVASHADAEHLYYVYTARYHRPTSMLLEEFRESAAAAGDHHHEESPSSSSSSSAAEQQQLLPMQDYMYYNGRADTMIDIGGAFASALLKKLELDYEFPPNLIKAPLNKPFDLMGSSMHLHSSKSNATVEAQEEEQVDEDPNMLLSDEMAFTEVGAVELVLGVVVLIIGLFVFILMMQVNPCCRRTCGSGSKKYAKEQPDKKMPLRQAMESSWRATVETLSSIVRAMNLEDELEEEEEELNDFDAAAAERSSYKHHSDRYQAVDNDVVMTQSRAEYIASKIKKQAMKQAEEPKFKLLRQEEEEDGSAEHVLENSGLESPSSSGLDAVTTTPPSSAASSVPAVATSSWLPGTTRKLPKFSSSSSSKWRRSRNKENRNNNEARTFAAKHYSNDIDVLVV